MTDAAEGAADPVEGVPADLAAYVDKEMFAEFQRSSQMPVETRKQSAPSETD